MKWNSNSNSINMRPNLTPLTVSFSNLCNLYIIESNQTSASKQSYGKRMAEAQKQAENRPDWDKGSVTTEQRNKRAENQMASKIAMEVLKDNSKLKGIHSKQSMMKILEKEALKQMQGPVISTINEKQLVDRSDPSNLPYLHKNPAV